MKKSLSKPAQKIIDQYLNLEIVGTQISCPYFNNRKQKVRNGLKVEVGKGSPKQITEETKRIAKKKNINLKQLNAEELRKLLIDNNIGIDCSGLAYYILNAEVKKRKEISLQKQLDFSNKGLIRRVIAKLRTVENIGVDLLAHRSNSEQIDTAQVQPGDIIAIENYGPQQKKSHIAVIHSVEYADNQPRELGLIHSFEWSSDGEYGGGVRKWKINIDNISNGILQQTWIEKGEKNENNETYISAQDAVDLSLRRLLALS
ncbi:MAG: hypothetical protein ABEJ02_03785 [Candidatus Paceibacteria bacterium]